MQAEILAGRVYTNDLTLLLDLTVSEAPQDFPICLIPTAIPPAFKGVNSITVRKIQGPVALPVNAESNRLSITLPIFNTNASITPLTLGSFRLSLQQAIYRAQ